MPRVFNKNHKGTPAAAVYVGRPSEWGNPFSHLPGTTAAWRVSSRDESVSRYREWISTRIATEHGFREKLTNSLGGKDLECWCAPHACHADVLLELANQSVVPRRVYAGIGSRETPERVLATMKAIGSHLAKTGWTLRSGGAFGADSAFEAGATESGGKAEIWLPWAGFNGSRSQLSPSPEAFELASQHHPAWERLGRGPRALHARNGHQILGSDLSTPVDFVVCWTKGGKGGGGTGQAIRLARSKGIQVFDLGLAGMLDTFREHVRDHQ